MIITFILIAVFMLFAWKVSKYEKALVDIMERLDRLENKNTISSNNENDNVDLQLKSIITSK